MHRKARPVIRGFRGFRRLPVVVAALVFGVVFVLALSGTLAGWLHSEQQTGGDAPGRDGAAPVESELRRQLEQQDAQLRAQQEELAELRRRVSQHEQQAVGQAAPPPQPASSPSPKSLGAGGGADELKRAAVKEAMRHAYSNYEQKAFGMDELLPVDGRHTNWLGLGLTLVDSLDTLWLMDLRDEFSRARNWVATELHFDKNRDVSVFETTIRVMGGLLSAFELSGDQVFLTKARELADRFLPAFRTATGIPHCAINLQTGVSHNPSWTGGASILSEVGSLQLEFVSLAHHTAQPHYATTATKVYDVLERATKPDGLYSVYVSPDNGQFTRAHVTLGALGDSFYEYLLKLSLMTGEPKWRRMYDDAAQAIRSRLVQKSTPNGLTYLAELIGGSLHHKMDHLVCFAGAMFALGAQGAGADRDAHMELAAGITETCWQMYSRQATGIAPEIVRFEGANDFVVPQDAKHYLLRPETVEALFYMYRFTHDIKYREQGWAIFQAIEKYCKLPGGYSGIRDVTSTTPVHDNMQQSFLLSEVFKYLYLLFSEDSLIPLDEYVFNTEAHPLKILK